MTHIPTAKLMPPFSRSSVKTHRLGSLGCRLRGIICFMPFLLGLTACGWHSVYGSHDTSGSAVAADLNDIKIDNIPDRPGQMLKNDLIDRMYGKGRPQHPRYELAVNLHHSEQDVGTLADATSTRTQIDMYGDYELKDLHGKLLIHGSTHSVTSYNRLDQQFGTLAAHDDAIQRTVNEVSEQLVNRISLYFAERGNDPLAPPLPSQATPAPVPAASP